MSSTVFENLKTVVQADWLNDVNTAVYFDLGGPGVLGTSGGSAKVGTSPTGIFTGTTVAAQLTEIEAAISSMASGVSSFNTRTGAVVLTKADVEAVIDAMSVVDALGYTPASLSSPTFTGVPQVPTAPANTRTNQIANTSFVMDGLDLKAPVHSPTFTGTPAAATAPNGTNTTQLATTAFVTNAVVASTTGVSSFNGSTGAISAAQASAAATTGYGYVPLAPSALTPYAPLASPNFTGNPTAPTQAGADNSTNIATTAFVKTAITAGSGVTSFKVTSTGTPQTGAVTFTPSDIKTTLCNTATEKRWVWNAAEAGGGCVDASLKSNSIYIQRNATYSGGSGVTGALYVETYAQPTVASNEWSITGIVNSYATTGDFVGVYGQGNSKAANGNVFGGCFEACDENYASTAAVSNLIGSEHDVWCNGTDNSAKRVGIDVAAGDAKFIRTGVWGSKGYVNAGIRIGLTLGHDTHAAFNYGLIVSNSEISAVSLRNTGVNGIATLGANYSGNAINLENCNITTNVALALRSGHAISFGPTSGTQAIKMLFNETSGILEFYNGSTRHGYINMAGGADVDLAVSYSPTTRLSGPYNTGDAAAVGLGTNSVDIGLFCATGAIKSYMQTTGEAATIAEGIEFITRPLYAYISCLIKDLKDRNII